MSCLDTQVHQLHSMLRGTLHSLVDLTLARPGNSKHFTVRVMRHGYHEYDDVDTPRSGFGHHESHDVDTPRSAGSAPRTLV
jgi:hypothetical protein